MATTLTHTPLYYVELRGDSRQRGIQHGRALREPIQRALDFYRAFYRRHIGLTPAEIRRRATRYLEPTARASARLMAEYEGIAEGSGQALEDVFALTARYEITFEAVALGECSNVFVPPARSTDDHTYLGQSWEWRPEVLDFRCVLVARCDDVPDHVMVSECGQPGKYGFNEHGLAVAETGLSCSSKRATGEQLFVVTTRAMLEKSSFEEARTELYRCAPEATISFLLADENGRATEFEATPRGVFEQPLGGEEIYWHTNHCRLVDEPCSFENSLARGRRWAELTATPGEVSIGTVRDWLADTRNGKDSICVAPDPDLRESATWLQTLSSIAIDLNAREMWVSDGQSSRHGYQRVGLDGRRG